MNRSPKNRCWECGKPVLVHGKNWAYIKDVQGYAHAVCPTAEDDDCEAI